MKQYFWGVLMLTGLISGSVMGADALNNRVLVKFRSVPGAQNLRRLQTHSSVRDLGALSNLINIAQGLGQLRYASSVQAMEASRMLASHPDVEWAQPDYVMRAFVEAAPQSQANIFAQIFAPIGQPVTPRPDPAYATVPGLPSPAVADAQIAQAWGLAGIHAPEAWELQKGSRNIVVADIDTGIDYTHEDLMNNLWVNPDATAADRHGYDFVNNDNMPYDDQGHGTHTAGSIGATGGNGIGISGVAQAVSVMGLKFLNAQGSGSTSDAIRAIDYAIAKGARVMSNSWGGPAGPGDENRALEEAVGRANTADILFVAAAGNDKGSNNDTKPTYPAAFRTPNMLTVASVQQGDGISFFSNIGPTSVHVAAPGSAVYSTMPGNAYQAMDGTSMACPHVAGLAALILSERPELTALQVKQIIMESVDAVPGLAGKIVTGGRINARSAIERARSL